MNNKDKTEELLKVIELNKSGYAGVLSSGGIVDRRKHPEATPVYANKLFNVSEPQPVIIILNIEQTTTYEVRILSKNTREILEVIKNKEEGTHSIKKILETNIAKEVSSISVFEVKEKIIVENELKEVIYNSEKDT